MNYNDITRRRAQGRRLSTDELSYVQEIEQEDKRMKQEEEAGTPHLGDFRISVIHLQGDHGLGGSVTRTRVMVETWSHREQGWVSKENAGWLADVGARTVMSWTDLDEIAKMTDRLGAYLEPRLTSRVERATGVWEYAVEQRSSD